MADLTPAADWFAWLGVAVGLYGTFVAGAAAAGDLAGRLRLNARSAYHRLRSWLGFPVTVHGAVNARIGFSGSVSGYAPRRFSYWPMGGVDAQLTALIKRTDLLLGLANDHTKDIAALRRSIDDLREQVVRSADRARETALVEVAASEAAARAVNANGLPGIAASIVLTGPSGVVAGNPVAAWCLFMGATVAATIYAAKTWRCAAADWQIGIRARLS